MGDKNFTTKGAYLCGMTVSSDTDIFNKARMVKEVHEEDTSTTRTLWSIVWKM